MFINSAQVPRWLHVLLTEKFYNACIIHQEEKKNEKNIFCLDCCINLCPHCLEPHGSHRLLQIRRYVYSEVVKVDDVSKLIDCTLVQPYTTNGAQVIFIHERPPPQSRTFRVTGNFCSTCERSLQEPYLFCSLSCKIKHLVRTAGSVSGDLLECNYMALPPETGSDDGLMTPDTVLESAGSARSSSGSGGCGVVVDCMAALACTATSAGIVRKKRSSISSFRPPCRPACSPVAEEISAANRRKGNPQRAPLY